MGILGAASAYGCEGKGEEYSREHHDGVEFLSPLTFLPLSIAGTDKEAKKDTYPTGSPSAEKPKRPGDKTRRSPYNMHCKKAPRKNANA